MEAVNYLQPLFIYTIALLKLQVALTSMSR